MKMCWETQLSSALLIAGFMSQLSATCHRVAGDNYRRLILAAYLERRWLNCGFSISVGADELEAVRFYYVILQLKVETER